MVRGATSWSISVLALAGCGRFGFDALGAPGDGKQDGNPGDGTTGDTPPLDALPPNLVAWLPLDDDFTSTVTARDVSGHGHDATCLGACPMRVAGRAGGFAASFDGSLTQLRANVAGTDLDFAGAFTVSIWVSAARTSSGYDMLISRPFGGALENAFTIDLDSMRRPEYYSQEGSTYGTPIPLDTWTHVAITFNGSVKQLYTNGTAAPFASASKPSYDTSPLLIGAELSSGSSDHYLGGSLADAMLFDRALTQFEIAALANQ